MIARVGTVGTISSVGRIIEAAFIRADLLPSADQAAEFAMRKGRQIVDEQGERLFD